MAPLNGPKHSFDIIALGAGTAGSGVVRYASRYGRRACVVEAKAGYGGTCVQVGCVPKKLMWIVTSALEAAEGVLGKEAAYALKDTDGSTRGGFAWARIKELRDAEVNRQQSIVKANFAKEGITRIQGIARLLSPTTVEITPTKEDGTPSGEPVYSISAPHVALTLGAAPNVPSEDEIPGAQYGITSDGFFALEERPEKVLVVGAGYIAVELSQILHALGTETHVAMRGDKVLKAFDPLIQDTITDEMAAKGITLHKRTHLKSIERCYTNPSRFIATVESGPNKEETTLEVDHVLFAIGRSPATKGLGFEQLGVKTDGRGNVLVDEYENTSVEGIYAVGDVTGKRLLTPVALAAGRRLAGRLFGPDELKGLKLSYDFIPSVIFAHPPVGSVGLTEPQADEKYGHDNVKVFTTQFTALDYKMMDVDAVQPTVYKVVCVGKDQQVVGLHIVGVGSDEMLQGFAVAIKMGATMRDFLDTVAIHPTSAEEITTITPPF